MNAGIDYGRGLSNIDAKTGIRYGVISQNSVLQAWADCSQPVYEEDSDCGEGDDDREPVSWEFHDADYNIEMVLDTDLVVTRSPFFTKAKFCSPCVPGAADLNEPCEDGVRAFCLGKDWFEDDKAPYPIYSVETGKLIE
jgi:hypothetical protein